MQIGLRVFKTALRNGNGFPERCNFRSIVKTDKYHIFEEDHVNGHWRIYRRESDNGITLSKRIGPLFPLGNPDEYDEWGRADPSVVYDDKYRMWFDAMNKNFYWDKIGYATSPDLKEWNNEGPVLDRGSQNEWDGKSVHHPCVIKHEGIYYMYYSGCAFGESGVVRNIGVAKSIDGLKWVKEKNNPIILAGDHFSWDGGYIRPSCPVCIKGLWVMFYWGFNKIHSMGLAVSHDLINWKKMGLILSGNGERRGITASQVLENKVYFTTWDETLLNIAEIIYE
jgi:predicted GH43/DUF377 family glycosyl hydrolase